MMDLQIDIIPKMDWWFSLGTPVTSTNKTDHHNIIEILLKVVLNIINQPNHQITCRCCHVFIFSSDVDLPIFTHLLYLLNLITYGIKKITINKT